jgi:hypothetical protein
LGEASWTRYHWMSVGSCLVVFVAAWLIADLVLEQVAHLEDEVAYLFQAQVFAMGKAHVPAPIHGNCFFAPFVLDHQGRRFGKYPPGWPALLALGVVAGQPWWVNAACVALTIALIFRLGREMHGPLVGATAAGLGSISPFLLLLSGSLMSHPACLLFLTLFLWCFWRTKARPNAGDGWALVAGVSLGCAFVIRPFTAVAVALPAGVWSLWSAIAQRDTSTLGRRGAWRRIWFVGLGFAPLALVVPLSNAIWTGDPMLSPYEIFWPYDRLGFGPGHGPLPEGNTIWLGLSSVIAALGHLANVLHGWPALSLTFVVLLFLFKPRRQADLFLGWTALSLILAYALYWTSGDVFGPRYAYEATSALLVLSAAGIWRVWEFCASQRDTGEQAAGERDAARRRTSVRWREGERAPQKWARRCGPVLRAVLVLLIVVNLGLYLPWQLHVYRGLYGITSEPREVLQEAGLHNALVIVRDENGWKDYSVAFSLNRPTLDGDVVYANDCASLTEQLLSQYPGRDVYYYDGQSVRQVSRDTLDQVVSTE